MTYVLIFSRREKNVKKFIPFAFEGVWRYAWYIPLSVRDKEEVERLRGNRNRSRATSVKYTQRYSPVRRFSKRARAFLPIDWSARIALFKANPLSRDSFSFHHSRNSTKFRVNDPCSSDTREGSFQEEIYRRNLKIFSRVGLERESRKIPRKMENISSKWKNSFVASAE